MDSHGSMFSCLQTVLLGSTRVLFLNFLPLVYFLMPSHIYGFVPLALLWGTVGRGHTSLEVEQYAVQQARLLLGTQM